MLVTRNTTVREIVESNEEVLQVFESHGVCVESECPDAILDFPVEDCEDMCHIDDIDKLIDDLNQFFKSREL